MPLIAAGPAAGFFGKIPARGDFVRAGLPASFVAPWDAWLQDGLAAGRAALAGLWDAAWLEAPVWRFRLAPGQCGPAGVLGLWMPSVDAAGRYFPLTIAAVLPGPAGPSAGPDEAGWLDIAEQVGRDAIQHDLSPAELGQRLTGMPPWHAEAKVAEPDQPGGQWWTDGSPYVPAGSFHLTALPDQARFAAMVRAPEVTELTGLEEQAT